MKHHLLNTAQNVELILSHTTIPQIELSSASNSTISSDEIISKLAYLIGALHDIGKATRYFQSYIRGRAATDYGDQNLKKYLNVSIDSRLKAHSRFGMVFAYWAIKGLPEFIHLRVQDRQLLAFVAAIVINRHHGDLINFWEEASCLSVSFNDLNKENSYICKQKNSIDSKMLDEVLEEISKKYKVSIPKFEDFLKLTDKEMSELSDEADDLDDLFAEIKKNCNPEKHKMSQIGMQHGYTLSLLLQFYFSLLQEADKLDAMKQSVIERPKTNFFEELTSFYHDEHGRPIIESEPNSLKETQPALYLDAVKHATSDNLEGRIFSMEAPTGSGKTLASIGWAFRLRKRLKEEKKQIYRVIYILPFTSVIDQTFEELEKIFTKAGEEGNDWKYKEPYNSGQKELEPELVDKSGNDKSSCDDLTGSTEIKINNKKSVPSNILLKHHYLSANDYYPSRKDNSDESADLDANEMQFYVEGWNSEIIVSTFVQFFHSILTSKKTALRKFSKFNNSIIILDEVQAFPIKYWKLFDKFIPKFLNFTNSYLLMSTATMPGIFAEQPPSVSKYGQMAYRFLNRTKLEYLPEDLEAEDLFDTLRAKGAFKTKGSFMFVLNTIRSSMLVYTSLKEPAKKLGYMVFYLSANIIPIQRKRIIKKINCLLKKKKGIILVSTQVIEAGVDVSFSQGFRAVAPMDSIIQTAGRVNRRGEHEMSTCWVGSVFVKKSNEAETVDSFDDQGMSGREDGSEPVKKWDTAKQVYDNFAVNITKKILKCTPSILEKEYKQIIRKYFCRAKEHVSYKKSREILEDICCGEFKNIQANFKLIKEEYTFPVYIPVDKEAQKIWKRYCCIRNKKDWKEKRNLFIKIKGELNKYIINVSVNKLIKIKDGVEDYDWIFYLSPEQIKHNKKDEGYYNTTTGLNVEVVFQSVL